MRDFDIQEILDNNVIGFDEKLLELLAEVTDEEEDLLKGASVDQSLYCSQLNFEIDSQKLLDTSNSITVRAHTRFADFPRHGHNYVEFMYVCCGSIEHIINDTDQVVAHAGDVLLFNQHAVHEIKAAQYSDVAVNFIVLPQYFDEALSLIGNDNLLSDFLLGSLMKNGCQLSYLHFVTPDVLPLRNLLENLVWSLRFPNSAMQKINQQTVALIMQLLVLHQDYLCNTDANQCRNPLVNYVLQKIEENYPRISLTEIADRLNVSVSYLSSEIKRELGSSYTDLLKQRRIERAVYLLCHTELTNEEIAHAIGYSTNSYFYRMFKSVAGISPKEYRDQFSRDQDKEPSENSKK